MIRTDGPPITAPASFISLVIRASVAMLVLCSAACHYGSAVSKGFIVDLAAVEVSTTCGDNSVVAVAIGRHRAKLNAEPDVAFSEAIRGLHEVMTHRVERIVYVKAEPDVFWGEFLELVDNVWPEVNVVSILTPQVEARGTCPGLSCRDCTRFGGFHHPPSNNSGNRTSCGRGPPTIAEETPPISSEDHMKTTLPRQEAFSSFPIDSQLSSPRPQPHTAHPPSTPAKPMPH